MAQRVKKFKFPQMRPTDQFGMAIPDLDLNVQEYKYDVAKY
jgi:hypothetical protein